MTHDPICPQGGGASITTTDGLGDFPCLCDLIGKVRQDERERAGIEQTVPSYEYPFSTAVTVEVDMNRYKWTAFGPWLDEDGPFVLYADAEAAIAAARADMADGQSVILASECEKQIARAESVMLAECIAAVYARIRPTLHPLENAGIGEALAALRALEEMP